MTPTEDDITKLRAMLIKHDRFMIRESYAMQLLSVVSAAALIYAADCDIKVLVSLMPSFVLFGIAFVQAISVRASARNQLERLMNEGEPQ
jgi:hypothetical protein